MATGLLSFPPISPFSARETEAEPYMHCLAAFENDSTFVALPSAVDLDMEEQLMQVEAVAASIVKQSKADKKKKKKQKDPSSGPPSPPDSGSITPRVTIAPCPVRLTPYIPPPNYGTVESHKVFRSSFPQDRNIDFVEKLGIRSILTLVDTDPTEGYVNWLHDSKITQLRIDIAPNKEGVVSTTLESICEALIFVIDARNYPLYIHCNQGKHRTGCVVGCLRKVQRMPIDDIIAEYRNYSDPKARDGDIKFIKAFDPEAVFEYAEARGLNGAFAGPKRTDSSIDNIDTLVAALAAGGPGGQVDTDMDLIESSSPGLSTSSSEGELQMTASRGFEEITMVDGTLEYAPGDAVDAMLATTQLQGSETGASAVGDRSFGFTLTEQHDDGLDGATFWAGSSVSQSSSPLDDDAMEVDEQAGDSTLIDAELERIEA